MKRTVFGLDDIDIIEHEMMEYYYEVMQQVLKTPSAQLIVFLNRNLSEKNQDHHLYYICNGYPTTQSFIDQMMILKEIKRGWRDEL